MKQIAGSLRQFPGVNLNRPLIDRTGLTENFDFILEFVPEAPPSAEGQPDSTGPTFLEALKEQLGLKLVRQMGPVDFLVIEHIEQPSEN